MSDVQKRQISCSICGQIGVNARSAGKPGHLCIPPDKKKAKAVEVLKKKEAEEREAERKKKVEAAEVLKKRQIRCSICGQKGVNARTAGTQGHRCI